MSSRPSSVIGAQSSSAPFSWASWYQGTMLEWCSISVSTIRSPSREVRPAPRVGDQVERLGRVADEDHLAAVGAEVGGDRGARLLVERGRLLGERVHPAVDVRVLLAPVAVQGLDHGERLLRGRAVVEVGERLAVHLSLRIGNSARISSIERGRAAAASADAGRGLHAAAASTSSLIQP